MSTDNISFDLYQNVTANDTRDVSSETNDFIVGALFLITSFFGLLTYIPCVAVMAKSKHLKSPCYTFMISLGISDCISLVGWVIIGLDTVTHGHVIPKILITIVLCFLVIGWGSLTTHMAMIAINRCVAVCFTSKQEILFSKKKMIILLAISWFYAIFIHASPTFIPPNMRYTMDTYSASWENEDITTYYTFEDITCCSLVLLICIVCYSSIMIKFARVRSQVAPNSVSIGGVNKMSAKDRKNFMFQFKLALQTAIRCLTFFVYDILYYVVSLYSTNVWAIFICSTYLWCFNNALDPWVYLLFNKQLRKVLKNYLLGRSDGEFGVTSGLKDKPTKQVDKRKSVYTVHMVDLAKAEI